MMKTDQLDLILHPIRMRIVLALTQGPANTNDIAQRLPDVAQATLYRHIKSLVDGGLLQIVEENQVRGTVEKIYALVDANALSAQQPDLEEMTADDFMRFFTAFTGTLLADFATYLERRAATKLDLAADGVGFHKQMLFMDDDELKDFLQGFQMLIQPYLTDQDDKNRQARLFSTIIMPSD